MNYRNLKIARQPKTQTSPKLRWLNYSAGLVDKSSPDYISLVTGMDELQITAAERKLEAMVREQLAQEFPNVEKMKTYEMLVDAVMLTIKKKQL